MPNLGRVITQALLPRCLSYVYTASGDLYILHIHVSVCMSPRLDLVGLALFSSSFHTVYTILLLLLFVIHHREVALLMILRF